MREKTIKSLGEFDLIRKIAGWVPCAKEIIRGIGDDAAVFRVSGNRHTLLTIDTIVEDVDFRRAKARPEQVGWKALAINLSDIAAMGGSPKLAVVSLTLPSRIPVRFVEGFYKGVRKLARRFQISIVGGDLSRGPKVVSTIAVLGEAQRRYTVFRDGARSGDLVCVTGRLGGSILGKHLNIIPRLKEGQWIARYGAS